MEDKTYIVSLRSKEAQHRFVAATVTIEHSKYTFQNSKGEETGNLKEDDVAGYSVEPELPTVAGPKSTIQKARESAERGHILRALEESNWNVSGAARTLGMERTNLHKRIRALGLSRGK